MRISPGPKFALTACWLFVVAVVPSGTIATSTNQVTIEAGGTLLIVANRYETTTASTEAANPGVNPNDLQIGQVVNVPSSQAVVSQDAIESSIAIQSPLSTTSLGEFYPSSGDRANGALPTLKAANTVSDLDSQQQSAAFTKPAALLPAQESSKCAGNPAPITATPLSTSTNLDDSGPISAVLTSDPDLLRC